MSKFVGQLKKYDDFVCFPKGASKDDVANAEATLGLKFAKEYCEYTEEVGAASANGHEFTGVVNSKHLNVVTATQSARKKNPDIPDELYVVENLNADGIVIMQDAGGKIYEAGVDTEVKKIAGSLADYIKE